MLEIDVEAVVGSLALRAKLPRDGGTTVLVGPNGAGKSTLLKCILGVVRPRAGIIALDEDALFDAEGGIDVPTEARRIGYVPQRYALFTHMTVADNVGFGVRGVSAEQRTERVRELLDDLGIAHLASRKAPSLSGGEAQRVALARALAIRPRALLLEGKHDEAIDYTARLIGDDPDPDPEARVELAIMMMSVGRDEDALSQVNQVLLEQPGNMDALRLMALINFRLGHFDAA